MAAFFSKKQKGEFRKRRRRIEVKHKQDGDHYSEGNNGSTAKKERQTEEKETKNALLVVAEPNSADGSGGQDNNNNNGDTASNSMVVIIPKKLSAQETKKFRKEARRKARTEGKDADKLEFVIEGSKASRKEAPSATASKSPHKKRRKRDFPCLNDLVKEEKEAKQKKEEEEAFQQSEGALSEDFRARYLALDCEMVGIGTDGKKSVLARASLVDWDGKTVFDTFVQVPTRVSDFRTHVSGVTAADIRASKGAMKEAECREKVAMLLKGKVLVGHALTNDLQALLLTHPKVDIRDTAKYRPFQRLGGTKWRPRKLRDLVKENLDISIQQEGQAHDSTEDANATMLLFRSAREKWEIELKEKASLKKRKTS